MNQGMAASSPQAARESAQPAVPMQVPSTPPNRVLLLTSHLSTGPIKDTHSDGSFHFFGTLQQQLARFVDGLARTKAGADVELHLIHDDDKLSGMNRLSGVELHPMGVPFRLPPIDARYSAYWELLQRLDPPADTCIFMFDLADVELLRNPRSLCETHRDALFLESGQCDHDRPKHGHSARHHTLNHSLPRPPPPNTLKSVRYRDVANYLKHVQKRNNYTGTPRLDSFLDDGSERGRLMFNAGIQGGTWRVVEPYLADLIARLSVHWLRRASLEHAQNFIDMLVVNEIALERQRRGLPLISGYPVGPLNMPNRGIMCGADGLAPNASTQLSRMAADDYFFAHKRRWLPGKPPVYVIGGRR